MWTNVDPFKLCFRSYASVMRSTDERKYFSHFLPAEYYSLVLILTDIIESQK